MLTIVNGDHLRARVTHVAENADAVGFVVGLVGAGVAVTHPMMTAYLNQSYIVSG